MTGVLVDCTCLIKVAYVKGGLMSAFLQRSCSFSGWKEESDENSQEQQKQFVGLVENETFLHKCFVCFCGGVSVLFCGNFNLVGLFLFGGIYYHLGRNFFCLIFFHEYFSVLMDFFVGIYAYLCINLFGSIFVGIYCYLVRIFLKSIFTLSIL